LEFSSSARVSESGTAIRGIVSYADIASDFAVVRAACMGLPRSPIALAAALSTAP